MVHSPTDLPCYSLQALQRFCQPQQLSGQKPLIQHVSFHLPSTPRLRHRCVPLVPILPPTCFIIGPMACAMVTLNLS